MSRKKTYQLKKFNSQHFDSKNVHHTPQKNDILEKVYSKKKYKFLKKFFNYAIKIKDQFINLLQKSNFNQLFPSKIEFW